MKKLYIARGDLLIASKQRAPEIPRKIFPNKMFLILILYENSKIRIEMLYKNGRTSDTLVLKSV